MRTVRAWRWVGLLLVLLPFLVLGGATGQDPAPPKVDLKVVKYTELGRIVRDLKGKVVIVDFWGDFCLPCKKEFPHLVELHKKYAKDGFDAVSVSVDPLDDPDKPADEVKTRALRFLQTQNATFTNLLLDEKADFWTDKLKTPTVPCVFVFNRAGKVAKKLTDNVSYAEVEKLVIELLKEK